MTKLSRFKNSRGALAAGAAVLLALGAAGGAGAVHATRPAVAMAPTVQTPIAKLPATSGVVTVKGRVAEVYGDRFVVQDGSGRTMIAAGRFAATASDERRHFRSDRESVADSTLNCAAQLRTDSYAAV